MPFDSNKIKFHDDMDMFFAMKDKWNPNDPKYKKKVSKPKVKEE